MSVKFITEQYSAKRGDKFVVGGTTWVVAEAKGAPQNIRAVRADGADEMITTRDELVRGFALFQGEGFEVPERSHAFAVAPLDAAGRTVKWLREERRRLDLQMVQLSALKRTLDRNLSRRDAELKQAAYSDKAVTNDKLREAAYKLSLTQDFDYLDWQRQLDELEDARAALQIEMDALRREYRTAEIEYEAASLGRRHAA